MVVLGIIVFSFLTFSHQLTFIIFGILSIFISCSYLVMWHDGAKEEPYVKEPDKWPHVTIIIPSFNTKATVFDCINSCKELEYQGKYDILVVDDGSTDGSFEMLQKVGGIGLLRNKKNMGKASAVNFALQHAKGEIVACIDSDSYPRKDALRKAVKHFYENDKIASVVVFVCVKNPRTLLQRIQEIEYWISFGFFFRTIASIDGLYVTPGPTAFYRKDVLLKLGGFDTQNLTEDMEIALRMQKHGYKIRACHETVVLTEVPSSLRALYRQRLRWYRGGVMNILKYIELFFNPKYGDFGLFILPTTLGSGFFAALFMAWTLLLLSKNFYNWVAPFVYSVDGGTAAAVSSLSSGALLFQSAWILGVFSLAIWFYFLTKSFEISHITPKPRHILPLIFLLFVYPFFIGVIFLFGYAYELFGAKYSW